MGDLCFNGRWASDYGITVERLPSRPMTKRQYSSTAVPGRIGNVLTPENYFSNISQPYNVWIKARTGETMTDEAAARLAEWLYVNDPFRGATADGYFWIEDTYSPSVKRRAILSDVSTVESAWNKAGRTVITFEEKPQKFNKDGLVFPDVADSDTWLTNYSKFDAAPLVKLVLNYDSVNQEYETGSVNFYNSLDDPNRPQVRVVVYKPIPSGDEDDSVGTLYIDCESCEIYSLPGGGAKLNRAQYCYVEEPTTGAASPTFPRLWAGISTWIGINNCDAYVMRRDFNL